MTKEDEARIANMATHLNSLQKEMEKIQLKLVDTPSLEIKTICHETKRYMELQNAAQFIVVMKETIWPTPQPQIVQPKKNGILSKLIN